MVAARKHLMDSPKIIEIAEWEDDQLLEKIQEGDHNAFTVLVKKHSSKFYALAFRILNNKDNAEDVVQDLFLKLWQNPFLWDRDRAKKTKVKFTTWFYRVVVNRALDVKKKRTADQLDSQYLDNAISNEDEKVEDRIDKKSRDQKIDKMLNELPDRQRLAINLCFYQGLSNKEAADIMNINVKALESLLMRGKTKLKNLAQDKFKAEIEGGNLISGVS